MNIIHDRANRGTTNVGWLDSKHTFSFGGFVDPSRIGVSNLRVINDDRVVPGAGFETHGHRNMEILTYVISGALGHKDSLGNGSVIRPGEIQVMSAGTGIRHSEMNASESEPVHFLQIWIEPNQHNIAPGYQQIELPEGAGENGFQLIAGPNAGHGHVKIHQDARVYVAKPVEDQEISVDIGKSRKGFLHVVKGQIELCDTVLREGDGLEVVNPVMLNITAKTDAELLMFDLVG